MKTMTCNQLGGACDHSFQAATFEEMAELSRQHGQEMGEKNDQPHIDAMNKMMEIMKDPDGLNSWMAGKKKDFDDLAED